MIIQLISGLVIDVYKITTETKEVVRQLMNALCIIVIFRSTNSILTKGVLRGGGDTRFLLAADMSAMWLVAVPLGVLGGLVFRLPAFYTYLFCIPTRLLRWFGAYSGYTAEDGLRKLAPIPVWEQQVESPLCEPQNTF